MIISEEKTSTRKKKTMSNGTANLDRWKAMHGLRSSSAAQRHVPKSRKGTRATNKSRAIRDARY